MRQRRTLGCVAAVSLAFACSEWNPDEPEAPPISAPPRASTVAQGEPPAEPTGDEPLTPAAASTGCLVSADRDGDGKARTVDECAGEPGLTGRPIHGQEDCDDTDPTREYGEQFYTDADGDGYGIPRVESVWGCRGDVIEGFAPNVDDCDDADPALHGWRYVDADGDEGGNGEPVCVGDGEPGFAPLANDCDDADPAIHDRAEGEQPLDGVDTNCDGDDYPHLTLVGGPLLAISEASRCEGSALSIVAVELNFDCGGGFGLQIGNRGSVAIESGRVLVTPSGGRGYEIELPRLAPGEVVSRLVGGGGGYTITLSSGADAGACTPMSEAGNVEAAYVDCF